MVVISCKKGKFTYVLAKNKINSEDFGYVLAKNKINSEDFGTAVVYGISIIDKKKVTAVENISDDFCFVHYLFDLIVEEELYPEHLYDVVEDFLSEKYPLIMSFKEINEHPYIA